MKRSKITEEEEEEELEIKDSFTVKEILSSDESEIELSYEGDELEAAENHMDLDLYYAAINGDVNHFRRILNGISTGDSEDHILSSLNPVGNTFLHVAAKYGNQDIVKFIASTKPALVLAKNIHGETVLHLAAYYGDKAMVEALVGTLWGNEREKHDLLMAENEMGNTALHQALLSRSESIATYLIEQDYEPSYHLNKHGESAIFLAAKAGLENCVISILELCTDKRRLYKLFENNSPIQAAIDWKKIAVLKTIINMEPGLIQMRDSEGRNPLHFAASLGHVGAVHYLLKTHKSNATRRDRRGELPIHLAARKGDVVIIHILLRNFPEPEALLDMSGCNILHIAAQSGRYNVFHYVLKNPRSRFLINMKNKFGQTPLHIASRNLYPKIVSTLTWDERVDIMAVDDKGMTALDATEEEKSATLKKYLTQCALRSVSVRQNSNKGRTLEVNYKGTINTLLVVATLVATVTFAAGFTMPGGYISSETGTDLAMPTMWRDTLFHVFVLCDTIAMYTSILVVTTLIWAYFGDTALFLTAIEFVVPLLGVALIMMSMAFTAGVTIVLTKLRWLQITLLVMSLSFITLMLLLLLLMFMPLSSRSRILRYLSYYPFCLLILISSRDY